jgi:hypothetical protein
VGLGVRVLQAVRVKHAGSEHQLGVPTQKVHPANPSTIQSCDIPNLSTREGYAQQKAGQVSLCVTLCVSSQPSKNMSKSRPGKLRLAGA